MKLEFQVPSMVCQGCVDIVTKAIQKVDASAEVQITLETKVATVETQASLAQIQASITEVGHTVG